MRATTARWYGARFNGRTLSLRADWSQTFCSASRYGCQCGMACHAFQQVSNQMQDEYVEWNVPRYLSLRVVAVVTRQN